MLQIRITSWYRVKQLLHCTCCTSYLHTLSTLCVSYSTTLCLPSVCLLSLPPVCPLSLFPLRVHSLSSLGMSALSLPSACPLSFSSFCVSYSATLPCYYRAMMSGLVNQVKAIPPPSKKYLPTTEVSSWSTTSSSLPSLRLVVMCLLSSLTTNRSSWRGSTCSRCQPKSSSYSST